MEHMENTKAAEKTRGERRKAQNRRQMQRGGTLYAEDAREMVKSTEAVTEEMAEQSLRKQKKKKMLRKGLIPQPINLFRDAIKAADDAQCKRLVEKKKGVRTSKRTSKEGKTAGKEGKGISKQSKQTSQEGKLNVN